MSSSPKNFNWFSILKSVAGLSLLLGVAVGALQKWGIRSDFLPPPLTVTATVRPAPARLVSNTADKLFDFTETKSDLDNKTVSAAGSREYFPDAVDALRGRTDAVAVETRQLLLRRWADQNPAAAAAWLAQMPADSALFEQVAIAWAGVNLSAAAAWVRHLPAGPEQQAATLSLAYEAARTKPVAALELARTLPPTDERDRLLVHAVSQWAALDSSAATVWVEKVSDSPLRQNLWAAVAVAVGKRDGATAATLVATTLPAGDLQNRVAVAIAQRWTQSAPAETAAWVSQFPDGPAREAAFENLQTSSTLLNQTALTTPQYTSSRLVR